MLVELTFEYSPRQLEHDLAALAAKFPALEVESVGKSAQGRGIYAAVLGRPDASRHVLVQAGIHGREYMTSLLVMKQLEYLLQFPRERAGGLAVCELLQSVRLHILPMTNPDGVAISQCSRPDWKANANGVDINRNFDAGWDRLCGPGAPCHGGYKGQAPGDQPETAALMDYTRRCDFAATISYHAYGSEIYWEYGQDATVLLASKSLAEAVSRVSGYPLKGSDSQDAGGYKDWAMSTLGIPSVTIEIGTLECPLPPREFPAIWARNRPVLPAAILWALGNG